VSLRAYSCSSTTLKTCLQLANGQSPGKSSNIDQHGGKRNLHALLLGTVWWTAVVWRLEQDLVVHEYHVR